MELSRRLAAIGAMVERGSRLADIGTDHGYLPIWLVRQGWISSAVAMDINEGPLLRAMAHVADYGLESKIRLKRSDGFEQLLPGEADGAVIAGMGGMLTIRILEQGREIVSGLRYLVLSPQSELFEVRDYLLGHGFAITAEDMVCEDGKYYTVMKAEPFSGEKVPWSYIEKKYGRHLLQSGKPVVAEYLQKEAGTLREVRGKLLEAGTARAKMRLSQVEEALSQAEEALSRAVGSIQKGETVT